MILKLLGRMQIDMFFYSCMLALNYTSIGFCLEMRQNNAPRYVWMTLFVVNILACVHNSLNLAWYP